MPPTTLIHVALSLIAIVTGCAVCYGLGRGMPFASWTHSFLFSTLLMLVTGFALPISGVTPAVVIDVICIVLLLATAIPLYLRAAAGLWKLVYIVGVVMLVYLNWLVLIAQLFQKVPALNMLAPTGGEPVAIIAQAVLKIVFIVVGVVCVRARRTWATSTAHGQSR
jgi:hypothetical protein